MILYHGSNIPNIKKLEPQFASEKKCVFLTHSKALATIYSYNPLTRPNGFFTYWWSKDGKLYYDEYFENQLTEIYAKKRGFVYECEGNLPQHEAMPWIYLSEQAVKPTRCFEIPDLLEALLEYEQQGLLTIRRYGEFSDKQLAMWEKIVKNSLLKTDLNTTIGKEYYDYVKKHFPNIDL